MVAAVIAEQPPRAGRGGRPRDPSRDDVIRAAILRLLGEVGYGALTMDAVAAEAGVGKATIYRRWRTKQDLVVDTVSEVNRAWTVTADTGSLEGDLRSLVHRMVEMMASPVGAATRSLLAAMQHEEALAVAFREGPLAVWRRAYDQTWERAQARGEVGPGLPQSIPAEATTALFVQRWLVTREPVDTAYADEVLQTVVLPLVRGTR
ncbi:transcriptional regulator, TetR family [Geodermatophilus dictyosporus]|uniref:Transcriptional regulator, TetR family n=1 Tax=Geodermatophilus dictyosporus TaxID=1523247 RepID=A0A1I5RKF3_9ACTN|nr:TetR/AcrR family transcriptional regulator [Geodermatophilus dictyosporus]SFP59054.1 transcriptional regulator, TetR family [Geodermatophilus dictyosporus]